MKRIPEHLRKEIFRANKKRNRLNNKYAKAITKISDINFNRIEVKLDRKELENDKQYSILTDKFDEYAYFYSRYDNRMGAEKIKHGKLKEYYDSIVKFKLKENKFCPKFISLNDVLNKKLSLEELFGGFYIGNSYFYLNYCSINAKTNQIDDYYFYTEDFEYFDNFYFLQKDTLKSTLILRLDAHTNEISKIYVQSFDLRNLNIQRKFKETIENIFYYINPKTLDYESLLVSINFPLSTKTVLSY